MEERKKYELLVFLAIYVIYLGLMVPVAPKMSKVFMRYLGGRYGEVERTAPYGPGETPARPPSPYADVLVLVVAAGVVGLATYGGVRVYHKLRRRDYRVAKGGRFECAGALAERPRCRHYRPTPSTECIHFLGSTDEGMCVRKPPGPQAKQRKETSSATLR